MQLVVDFICRIKAFELSFPLWMRLLHAFFISLACNSPLCFRNTQIRAKKVFNNEDEFGMIPNKHLNGSGFWSRRDEKTDFFSLSFDLKEIWKRFIYKSFAINIQIVFHLYIAWKWFVYKSQAEKGFFESRNKRGTRLICRRIKRVPYEILGGVEVLFHSIRHSIVSPFVRNPCGISDRYQA